MGIDEFQVLSIPAIEDMLKGVIRLSAEDLEEIAGKLWWRLRDEQHSRLHPG